MTSKHRIHLAADCIRWARYGNVAMANMALDRLEAHMGQPPRESLIRRMRERAKRKCLHPDRIGHAHMAAPLFAATEGDATP